LGCEKGSGGRESFAARLLPVALTERRISQQTPDPFFPLNVGAKDGALNVCLTSANECVHRIARVQVPS
jgi:hypothetical protein